MGVVSSCGGRGCEGGARAPVSGSCSTCSLTSAPSPYTNAPSIWPTSMAGLIDLCAVPRSRGPPLSVGAALNGEMSERSQPPQQQLAAGIVAARSAVAPHPNPCTC